MKFITTMFDTVQVFNLTTHDLVNGIFTSFSFRHRSVQKSKKSVKKLIEKFQKSVKKIIEKSKKSAKKIIEKSKK